MQANETMGTGAVLELSEPADGSRLLDTMAKAPWPQNALASILGITLFQAASLVDACPESLGDISYMLGHISVSQPDYETMLREFYQEHHTGPICLEFYRLGYSAGRMGKANSGR